MIYLIYDKNPVELITIKGKYNMISLRPVMRTIVGLPLIFAPCSAKIAQKYTAKTATIVAKTTLNADTFQKSATKVVNEASKLPIKSGSYMNSRTALTPEDLDKAIDELIKPMNKKSKKNALRGKGKVFYEMGEKYGVNPVSILSIAMTESGRGISSAALTKNNVGGLTGSKGRIHFDSVDSCIESMAKLLQKHIKNGRTTIEALGRSGKYCAKSQGKAWIKHNNFYIKKIETFSSSQN